jgi:hypothetical protein
MKFRTNRMMQFLSVPFIGGALALTASAQSVTTTIEGTPGNYSRDTTVTGANGKTATYQNDATWGNGSYTGNKTVTGPDGKTAASHTTASYAPGSTSRQTTTTGFNGATTSYSNNRNW